MKLRSTTPASVSITTRIILVGMSGLLLLSIPIQMAQRVFADQFDNQINALQQEINSYNAQASKLASQASTLQSAIAQLQNQANSIQAQINLSQAQYDKLVAQITDTEKQIKENQVALGTTMADMYVDGSITPIEMLASSKNISDYLNKQEYQASIRDKLTSTISKIQNLKAQLVKQQTDVKAVLDKQQAQKASLVATQSQQQNLLNQTQGQEAAYQQLVAQNNQKLADVAAQQRAYYQSLVNSGVSVNSGVHGSFQFSNWSGNEGCGGGYPYCQSQDSGIDPWGLLNRECVSYVAWALVNRFNKSVSPFSGSGNAYQWPYYAQLYSGATVVTNPQPGDAVVLPSSNPQYSNPFLDAKSTDTMNFHQSGWSPFGHLMIVESVSGSTIHVSQFNFYGTGEYSTMDIQNSGIILLRFPNA